jgi:hypothetical protein
MIISEFLSQVRDVGQFPDTDEDLTDSFILTQAYNGLLERYTQPVILLRNGSWLHKYQFTTVGYQSMYRIPSRSSVQGLEKLEIALGSASTNNQFRLLNVLTNIQSTDYEGGNTSGHPYAFTYITDCVNLYPTPSQSGWRVNAWYYLRPSTLSATASKAISVFTGPTGTDTYTITATAHGLAASGFCDLQHSTGNCEMVIPQLAFVRTDANIITVSLTANQAAQVSIGETVLNAAGTTSYIQLPQELCNSLVSYVGAVCLAEKGDTEKAQVFSQKCETAIKNIVDVAMPRSKGQPPVFKTRNTYLRRRVGRWGGGWGGV